MGTGIGSDENVLLYLIGTFLFVEGTKALCLPVVVAIIIKIVSVAVGIITIFIITIF